SGSHAGSWLRSLLPLPGEALGCRFARVERDLRTCLDRPEFPERTRSEFPEPAAPPVQPRMLVHVRPNVARPPRPERSAGRRIAARPTTLVTFEADGSPTQRAAVALMIAAPFRVLCGVCAGSRKRDTHSEPSDATLPPSSLSAQRGRFRMAASAA